MGPLLTDIASCSRYIIADIHFADIRGQPVVHMLHTILQRGGVVLQYYRIHPRLCATYTCTHITNSYQPEHSEQKVPIHPPPDSLYVRDAVPPGDSAYILIVQGAARTVECSGTETSQN